MKLITGNCLLASAAMVMDVHPDVLTELIGHDGKEIIFPKLPMPISIRGFHIQEVIDCAFEYGYSVTEIQALPSLTPDHKHEYLIKFNISNDERFLRHITYHKGIITGETKKCGHAVAWDGEMVFDPRGCICKFDSFDMDILNFYRFDKIIPHPNLETVKCSLKNAKEGRGCTIDKILESM